LKPNSQKTAPKIKKVLKGPKHEIFIAGIFTEIRPVWVGDLETRPKNLKSLCLGLILPYISWDFCFSTVGHNAKKIKKWELGEKKVDLDCFYVHLFSLKRFFGILNFYSV
jgi:hypothetical protein